MKNSLGSDNNRVDTNFSHGFIAISIRCIHIIPHVFSVYAQHCKIPKELNRFIKEPIHLLKIL